MTDQLPPADQTDAEPSASGWEAEPTTSGRVAEPTAPGREAEQTTSGREAEPAAPGREAEPTEPRREAEPPGAGREAEPAAARRVESFLSGREVDGEPFAAGREADVFVLDGGRVLRRYRTSVDVAGEAAVMGYVGGFGYPVPKVYAAQGPDMVMERLDGPTMAQAALAGALPLEEGAVILADLLRRLHELPGRSGAGTILHLDLHPENVLLTGRGPVVIDWRNSRDGPGDLDTALTALILAQVAIGSIEHPLGVDAGVVLDRFLELAPGDPIRMLDDAVAFRRQQSTMSIEEVGMLGTAAARVLGRNN